MKTEQITANFVFGYGSGHSTRELRCRFQCGNFYVDRHTLNASSIGVGQNLLAALKDYANKIGASSYSHDARHATAEQTLVENASTDVSADADAGEAHSTSGDAPSQQRYG